MPSSRTADAARCEGRQLLGVEPGIAEVRPLPGDAVAVDRRVVVGHSLDSSGMPMARSSSLSRSNCALEAGVVLGVAGHALADLLGRDRPVRAR